MAVSRSFEMLSAGLSFSGDASPLGAPSGEEKLRLLALLRKHGFNATSFQSIGRSFRYWFDGSDACVAYVDTGSAWVVAGAPIAAAHRLSAVATRFVEVAQERRRRVCFFGTESRFISEGLRATLIGQQAVYDPRCWGDTLIGSRSLREQLRRARAKGVVVEEVDASGLRPTLLPLRLEVEALVEAWLASRPMAPMGFLVDLCPFEASSERRYWIARQRGFESTMGPRAAPNPSRLRRLEPERRWERSDHRSAGPCKGRAKRGPQLEGGAIVGFLVATPVYARRGWLVEHLLRGQGAPNGTAELLVDALMRRAGDEDSAYVTLGLAALAGPVPLDLRIAGRSLERLYRFRGLRAFKAKFKPSKWEPIYLSFPRESSRARALIDTLAAFANGSLTKFALHTALRYKRALLLLVAILLIPWTLITALFDQKDRGDPAP